MGAAATLLGLRLLSQQQGAWQSSQRDLGFSGEFSSL